ATHTNNMEADMSKSLVAASFPQTIRLLTNVWREANTCQENLGQLPLTSMELAGTKNLLANVGAFCFNTAQEKLVKGQKIKGSEWEQLKTLRNRTKVMVRHLANMQQNFFNSRAKWLDVDRNAVMGAAGMADNMSNNKVTKSFLMLEDGLKRVPDVAYEGNNLDFTPKPTGLTGKNVSIKEAELICQRFLATDYPNVRVKYERTIRGGFPSYMMRATVPNQPEDRELRCSISVKGGHMAWVLGDRDVDRSKLSLDQCSQEAVDFLKQKGYPNMKVVAKDSFENIATLTCAPERNNVLYYPELVKVQVAQDNGDVLGCDFVPYLTFNDPQQKTAPKPAQSKEQIQKTLNEHFKPNQIQLAQVLDEMYNKVLCYEVSGNQGGDRFLIYYNASTGKEEKIRRVDQDGNELI
ncbi:MAG TPA: PepSY1/2 domain-containing protein, partial [Bacillota bacterium]|nr:PepSY1/2 domain-containing protein [Bacillota bacterium]